MKKNNSNRWALTILCLLVSMLFVENGTVYAAEQVKTESNANYTIIYDGNGANGAAPTDHASYRAGSSAVIMSAGELTKNDKTLTGWSVTPNSTKADYLPGETIKVQNDTTLYAVWSVNQTSESTVIISNSGKVRRNQTIATSESYFPDRTFVDGN